jgi:hypothetical protein
MKATSYLTAALISAFGLVACTAVKMPPPVSDAEKAQIDQLEQQVFDKNPDLKTQKINLQQRVEDAEKKKRQNNDADAVAAARADLEANEQKIRAEAYKIDPSSDTIYQRIASDKYFARDPGLRKWASEFGGLTDHAFWSLCPLLLSLLAVILGIFLQFRPPSWASAHVLLLVALLPAVLTGYLALRFVDLNYGMSYNGIGEGPYFPQILILAHHFVAMAYLHCLPALALYVILVVRLLFNRQRNSS